MSDIEILKNIINKIPEIPNWEDAPLKEVNLENIWANKGLTNCYATKGNMVVGLNLSKNQLKTLPQEIEQLINLKSLDLRDNSFNIPNEIYLKSPQEQIQYILNLHIQGKRPLNEGKIIVLGSKKSGKTALIKRLINQDLINQQFDMPEPTIGIDITPWKLDNDIRMHVWDFGSDKIIQALYHFFITPRTLYLIVVTQRTGNEKTLEYWLQLVRTYEDNSPVLIVVTKSDSHNLKFDENRLIQLYPNIVGFFRTSASKNLGISDLVEIIKNQLSNYKLKHVKDLVPKFWIDVKNSLIKMQKIENTISIDDYRDLCFDKGVKKRKR